MFSGDIHIEEPLAKVPKVVIPVETGIQKSLNLVDSGFRRNDGKGQMSDFFKRF
jgi:hypothetical protein